MNRLDRSHLEAEVNFLEQQLEQLGERATLTRRSLSSRLDEIRRQLAAFAPDLREPAKVVLTFRGRPVLGTHGMMADFGAAVTRSFSDAVSAMAASIDRPLNAMGPIPNREQNRLLITGTAIGSFGFEFEEMGHALQPIDQRSTIDIALERTQQLLESTTETDDVLADRLLEVDPRALEKVKGFLRVLADEEATCAMERDGVRFAFSNVEQVVTSLDRLSSDNIREENILKVGVLTGVIPGRRLFEFTADDDAQPIFGTIGQQIEEPGLLTGHWGDRFSATIHVTRVGNGRPRYLLIRADRVDADPPPPETAD